MKYIRHVKQMKVFQSARLVVYHKWNIFILDWA